MPPILNILDFTICYQLKYNIQNVLNKHYMELTFDVDNN